jgi:hypothetical protein
VADLPRPHDTTGAGDDRPSPPRMPRWVKVSGIVVAVLVILVVLMMLLAGGGHGPGRHMPGIQSPPIGASAELTLSGGGTGSHPPSEVSRR